MTPDKSYGRDGNLNACDTSDTKPKPRVLCLNRNVMRYLDNS